MLVSALFVLVLALEPVAGFGLVVPSELVVESELQPAISASRGGRLDVRGRIDGVPLARRIARAWIGREGTPLLVLTEAVARVAIGLEPTIDADAALALLEASGLAGSRGATSAELVIDPDPSQSRLVWRIDPPVDPVTFDNRVFFVDAHEGSVRIAFNRTRAASVEAYPVNPVQTPAAAVFELNDSDPMAAFLEGQYFRVRNCTLASATSPCAFAPTLVADVDGNFLYPVPDISVAPKNIARDDAYAEVSAYFHADRFHQFLADLGDPGLDCSQGDTQTNIRVNVHGFVAGEPEWFANAFYTGDCDDTVVLGQGPEHDFAWDGEVVVHELGHGITDRQAMGEGSLGGPRRDEYSAGNDAGAINEGTSDYLGSVMDGGRIYSDYLAPDHSRDLGTDAACPAGLPGEVHDDGIVWASALLDITDVLGFDFVPVVIDTLGMVPFDVSFDVAADTLETIARDALGEDAGAVVAEVMSERGLAECTRVAPIEDAQYGMWLLPASWDVDYNPVRPPPFQLEIAVPPNATSFTVSFEPFDYVPEGKERNWSVDVVTKLDEPIVFTYRDATGVTYVDADSTGQASFDDDNRWTIAVEGGERLYAALLNRGVGMVRLDDITIEYELVEGESSSSGAESSSSGSTSTSTSTTGSSTTLAPGSSDDSGETSGDANAEGDDGCGCHSARGQGVLALLIVPAFAAIRRRRLRRSKQAARQGGTVGHGRRAPLRRA